MPPSIAEHLRMLIPTVHAHLAPFPSPRACERNSTKATPLPAPVLPSRTTRTASTALAPKCWISSSSCRQCRHGGGRAGQGGSSVVATSAALQRESAVCKPRVKPHDKLHSSSNAGQLHLPQHASHTLASCGRLPTNRVRMWSKATAPLADAGAARSTRMW